jgi:hypothetical protein
MEAASGDISGLALARRVAKVLVELRDAYPAMLEELGDTLRRELRAVRKSGEDPLPALRRRAEVVRGLTGNFRLDALATRLTSFTGSLEQLEGIASLAANKPPRDWVDRDVLEARIELAALAQQFLKAEGLARVGNRADGRIALAVYISDPSFPEPQAQEIELSAADRTVADALAAELSDLMTARDATHEIALAALANLGLRLGEAQRERDEPAAVRVG